MDRLELGVAKDGMALSSDRRGHMLANLLSLILTFPQLPPGAVPDPALRTQLSGDWVLDESPAAVQSRVDAAVQKAEAEFFWALRPLVRPKLREGAAWCARLQLDLDARHLRLQCPGQGSLVRRLDDGEGPVRLDDGRVITTTTALRDARTLELRIVGEQGLSQARYHSPAADRLVVEVAVSSPYLSAPMRWTLNYRRAEATRHAAAR